MEEEELQFYRENDTELQNHEYFKESVDSAVKIGSISLNLDEWAELGSVSLKDCRYLAEQLKDSNIENLKFKNFSMNDNELTVISAGIKHSKIKKLILDDDKFGRDGLLALSYALKESKIEKLQLFNNKSLESDAIHILINSLPLSNISSLQLGFIGINFHCLKHLANTLASTKITVLCLKSCRLDDKDIRYLSKKLNNSKVQSLNLSDNGMSADSLQSLADILENTAITELNIHGNKIGTTGAQYLAGKLSKSVVQDLDIGGNQIKSEGCLAIGNVIHFTQIIKLNLEKNSIDSSGITSLAANFKQSNVRHLNLNENNLQISGAQTLADGIKDSELEYLNVDSNKLSNVGMGMILDVLQFTRITDFRLDSAGNMKKENMKLLTNAFKFLKLKKLDLILPRDDNMVQLFCRELKTFIESNNLDEILPIKNKMEFSISIEFSFSGDYTEFDIDAIKHFHMKKLLIDDHRMNLEVPISSIVDILINKNYPISNLTTLNLNGNYLGNEGAITLAKNFKYLKLTYLDLDCTDLGNDGVIAIADELKNSQIRYLSLGCNGFDAVASSYLTNVVKNHPVRICLNSFVHNYFSAEDQIVIKNINYMFLRAQLLVHSVSDNSPIKYDKDMIEYLKAYEIFKSVDLLWESERGQYKYDYNRIDSEIRCNVTRNFLKIIGVVNSDEIISSLLPTEIIIMICSYLKLNDIKLN